LIAAETGVWESGTNVELNLSTTGSISPETPQPTNTSIPTQTSVIFSTSTPINAAPQTSATLPMNTQMLPQESKTNTIEKTTPTVTEYLATGGSITIDPAETKEATQNPLFTPNVQTKENEAASDQEQDKKLNVSTMAIIVFIVIAIVSSGVYWLLRRKRNEF